MFKYSHAYAKKCEVCQKLVGREKKPAFPLQPISVDNPFSTVGFGHNWGNQSQFISASQSIF
jgi:hypothetical protein